MRAYSITTRPIRRATRCGIVRLAAEQASDCLYDDLRHTQFNYTGRNPQSSAAVLAPVSASTAMTSRQQLWNATQNAAVRMDGVHVAMLVTLELPFTVSQSVQTRTVRTFAEENLVRRNLIVDMTVERQALSAVARLLVAPAQLDSAAHFDAMTATAAPRRFMRWQRDWDSACARELLGDLHGRRSRPALAFCGT